MVRFLGTIIASVKALKQKDSEYGIVQLHERFRDIIEEEMVADAAEYGYDPIRRKAPSDEKRQRSDVDVFREMAAERAKLEVQNTALADREGDVAAREANIDFREAMQKQREDFVEDRIKYSNQRSADVGKREKAVKDQEVRQRDIAARQDEQNRYLMQAYDAMLRLLHQLGDERSEFESWDEFSEAFRTAAANYAADVEAEAKADALVGVEKEKRLYASAREIFESRVAKLNQIPEPFQAWAEKTKMAYRGSDGKPELHTVAEWWQQHVEMIRQGAVKKPEQKEIIRQADKGMGE